MTNFDQIKLDESIRELTLDEVEAISGGDGGGPAPTCCGCNTPKNCDCGCTSSC